MLSTMMIFICALWIVGAATSESPAMPATSYKSDLAPRQLFAGCGLSWNIWGQIDPVQSSGYANLCLQCRVNVFGVSLDFNYFNSLSQSVGLYGVSASNAMVLQSSISDELNRKAAGIKSKAGCDSAFAYDSRATSHSFVNGRCRVSVVDYVTNNRAPELVSAFQNLYQSGGSKFCSICSNDRSCSNPSQRARRSLAENKSKLSSPTQLRCPTGLTACPLSTLSSFNSSAPYECLDISEEVNSCGGCATLREGVDCSAIKGVRSSSCSKGKCEIFSCVKGYWLSESRCIKTHKLHATKAKRL